MVADEPDIGDVSSFPKPGFHQAVEDARARLREFYRPANKRYSENVAILMEYPMPAPSERILYQHLQMNTEAELTRLVEIELKKGIDYARNLDAEVPGSIENGCYSS